VDSGRCLDTNNKSIFTYRLFWWSFIAVYVLVQMWIIQSTVSLYFPSHYKRTLSMKLSSKRGLGTPFFMILTGDSEAITGVRIS
jgi:hypothetical protein